MVGQPLSSYTLRVGLADHLSPNDLPLLPTSLPRQVEKVH
ncbi:conserved hypothetical protein [Vibrio cholerae O1 str. 2010EL-1786]|uniref:Uncharacterized protein n=4 Tax=Vibrio cholerae TaxID=666 RepID=Q9KVK5_VIBCH|nr:hypothetical protein VC_0138 [Vibrio cholerae O1 biovar El Tor str. N16961]ABQ19895.1 hypothetical protein VC0395_A2382 [Vibrio cholerae O395]ACP04474.1 conserved hypothetical protein [Vibrio cholerae M66-2]AET27850.1 conserved hypothetical protein [Vibrio cholerae O1 str. 2010EL-1786]APF47760.1 hypothetical protein ASZ80_00136 [Vibrio cholerae]EAZ73103.1 hypothetical protein A5C_0150 [Vibrio cholerae NCTC 8457]EAZ77372.1 hypothetical protein A5E_0162 [Vibrio cholerae B33]EET25643.1 conse